MLKRASVCVTARTAEYDGATISDSMFSGTATQATAQARNVLPQPGMPCTSSTCDHSPCSAAR